MQIAKYWSAREVCRSIGYGIGCIAISLLIAKLLYQLAEKSAPFWLIFLFALLFMGLFGAGIWLVAPATEKLTNLKKPAFCLSTEGIRWGSHGTEFLPFHVIRRAEFQDSKENNFKILSIELYTKTEPQIIDVTQIRGDFRQIAEDINFAIHGHKPWKREFKYVPNTVSRGERLSYIIFGGGLATYSLWGLWIDDVVIPAKRGPGVHFHGAAALFMGFALFMASLSLLIEVIDHYDRRNNEHWYDRFICIFVISGWLAATIAYQIK